MPYFYYHFSQILYNSLNVMGTKRNTEVHRKRLSVPKWGRNSYSNFKFEFTYKRKKVIGNFLIRIYGAIPS